MYNRIEYILPDLRPLWTSRGWPGAFSGGGRHNGDGGGCETGIIELIIN